MPSSRSHYLLFTALILSLPLPGYSHPYRAAAFERAHYLPPEPYRNAVKAEPAGGDTEIQKGISLLKGYPHRLRDLPLCIEVLGLPLASDAPRSDALKSGLDRALDKWNALGMKLFHKKVFETSCAKSVKPVHLLFSTDSGNASDGSIRFGEVFDLSPQNPRQLLVLRNRELDEFNSLLDKMRNEQVVSKKLDPAQRQRFETAFASFREQKLSHMIDQVLIHELGHLLGLGHNFNADEKSVMDYSDRTEPSEYDAAALRYRFDPAQKPAPHWKARRDPASDPNPSVNPGHNLPPNSGTKPGPALTPDPTLGKVTATCRISKNSAQKSDKRVYFFKQWHLPPEANTRLKPGPHPQDSNLESIHLQLDRWIEEHKIQSVIAEGCTGSLDESSAFSVNGWTVKDLQVEVPKPGFARITTSVPLKLEARHGSALESLCGEQEGLVKEQLLGFSDARADVGYLSRILQYQKDPVRLKPYLADVIDLFKLPKNTNARQAAAAIKKDLKQTLKRIRETLEKRNQSLVDAIIASKAQDVAVVYGGMHADGVKSLLEKRGLACLIIEPTGYQNNEAALLEQLEAALKKL